MIIYIQLLHRYLTIHIFFLSERKKSTGLQSFRSTMVSEHSWCVSIELHTNAAQLKFGDKKYNYICNFFLCSVLHLSYQKVIFHKCIWFATSRRFILRSFSGWGRGDHWNIVKMYWSEFFICSRFGWSSFPPHFKAKYVTLFLKGFCSSQVFRLRVWRFFQIQHTMHVQTRTVSITTGCPTCSPLIPCCNTGITFLLTWLSLLRCGIPFIKAHMTLCEGRFNCGPSKPLLRMSESTNDCNVI